MGANPQFYSALTQTRQNIGRIWPNFRIPDYKPNLRTKGENTLRNQGTWTPPRSGMPKIPKIREYAQVKMSDGSVMTGYVFVEATSRIQDVLNSATQFIPFVDENEVILLLNKASISHLRPFDA
ncbi:MAG: hypothetical protein CMM52_13125 [Rhodospirillaceae bacterium]|nr:hypothetical protein [Rhodospirillaceae bacterium]